MKEIDNFIFGAHGTDVTRFRPRPDVDVDPLTVVFSGVMRTPTNVQAVQWFATHVWPVVLSHELSARLIIVGREPSKEILALANQSAKIEVTGTVDDPSLYIAAAHVCINPMQAGGGMQNKLIEYLASGKPVVATSVANEGIGAPSNVLLTADSADDFAARIVQLFRDPELCEALSSAARSYALAEWTWERHFRKLEDSFRHVTSETAGA